MCEWGAWLFFLRAVTECCAFVFCYVNCYFNYLFFRVFIVAVLCDVSTSSCDEGDYVRGRGQGFRIW